MNQYEITTAQNVTIRLTIANMGDRILACLIDMFILVGYMALVFYVLYKIDPLFQYNSYGFWWFFTLNLPVYFYSLLFEYFMNGQTPGKRLRKIKVVRMDGESLTLGNCIIRWLFRLVDIWFDSGSVAIVTATFSKIHQRVGDMIAGTIVISTRAESDINLSIYADQDPSGVVQFPQVERLKLSDIEIVNEALTLYYERDKFDYILLVSAQLKRVLDVMPEMDDLTFVKRIVTDYNLLHRVPLI
jgi:uncharacterized RDD family membrane protein YckC